MPLSLSPGEWRKETATITLWESYVGTHIWIHSFIPCKPNASRREWVHLLQGRPDNHLEGQQDTESRLIAPAPLGPYKPTYEVPPVPPRDRDYIGFTSGILFLIGLGVHKHQVVQFAKVLKPFCDKKPIIPHKPCRTPTLPQKSYSLNS